MDAETHRSILHQATRSTLLVDLLHKAGHIQLRQANPQGGHLTSLRHIPCS